MELSIPSKFAFESHKRPAPNEFGLEMESEVYLMMIIRL